MTSGSDVGRVVVGNRPEELSAAGHLIIIA
jgi:hypothetical protein